MYCAAYYGVCLTISSLVFTYVRTAKNVNTLERVQNQALIGLLVADGVPLLIAVVNHHMFA